MYNNSFENLAIEVIYLPSPNQLPSLFSTRFFLKKQLCR